jgi:hypothetical protein
VHGELADIPSVTKSEAVYALGQFTDAYNKADQANNPALDAGYVTGPLAAINQASLKAKAAANPNGNPNYAPLQLTDPKFDIPKQVGWPKFFVADTQSNRGNANTRWLLVFTRSTGDQLWQVSFLSILRTEEIPEFATDAEGLAQPVDPTSPELAVPPGQLSADYAAYLTNGGTVFADGQHTSQWRATRAASTNRPGLTSQFIDQSLTSGGFAPVGLRTKDGAAVVFFATRHYEKQTAAAGVSLNITSDVKALMTGTVKNSVTLERVSNQAVLVPPATAADRQVQFLNRIQGLVGAKGE